eukprot:2828352-Prymnesium_polylepis.1
MCRRWLFDSGTDTAVQLVRVRFVARSRDFKKKFECTAKPVLPESKSHLRHIHVIAVQPYTQTRVTRTLVSTLDSSGSARRTRVTGRSERRDRSRAERSAYAVPCSLAIAYRALRYSCTERSEYATTLNESRHETSSTAVPVGDATRSARLSGERCLAGFGTAVACAVTRPVRVCTAVTCSVRVLCSRPVSVSLALPL